MSGSWDAMLRHEAEQSTLARRRELARKTKPELITACVELEAALASATAKHEIGGRIK